MSLIFTIFGQFLKHFLPYLLTIFLSLNILILSIFLRELQKAKQYSLISVTDNGIMTDFRLLQYLKQPLLR